MVGLWMDEEGMKMRWASKDLARYEEIKEYLDTAILGVFRIRFDENRIGEVEEFEKMNGWLSEAEQQLKGRLFLFPPYPLYGAGIHLSDFSSLRTNFSTVILLPFQEDLETPLQEMAAGINEVVVLKKPNSFQELYEQIMAKWHE